MSAVVVNLSLRQVGERINLLIREIRFGKTEASAADREASSFSTMQNTLSDKIRLAAFFRIEGVFSVIQPSNVFKDNLAQLPAIDAIERIDLLDGKGAVVASIENKPGKQGSLAVYNYLQQAFGTLDVKAAEHGLAVFAEHTADARNRPGAHPNVDHLLAIVAGGEALRIDVVAAG